jgi:CHAT domain
MTTKAQDLLGLAEQDPQGCVRVCEEILAGSESNDLEGAAHRALGIAYRELGDIEESIRELGLARDHYRAHGEVVLEAESVISLAWSMAISGQLTEAVGLLDPMLDHSDQAVRAHAQVQKAGLIARAGDFDGALDLYESAQPSLEELEDLRWLAILRSTRGLVETYGSQFEAAEADLEAARSLYDRLEQPIPSAEMTHNLGFVAVQQGDIARGLGLMLDAEELLETSDVPIEAIAADRAYAYMLAGLPGEAYRVASHLARQLAAQGRGLERTEALYLGARAALANGDAATAVNIADEAATLAAEQGRATWELMASLVREEACLRGGFPGDPTDLVRLAAAFADREMLSEEIQAGALAALRHLQAGDDEAAVDLLSNLPATDSVRSELSAHLLVAMARATVALAKGDSEEAAAVMEGAADLVDDQRALLSATEARAGVSRLAEEIAVLGVEARHEAEPSVIAWLERFRGASLRMAPVVMSSDTELADALAELRPIERDLSAAALAGGEASELAAEARRLEKRVHDLAMAREEGHQSGALSHGVDDVLAELGPRRLLYIYDVKGRTYGEVAGQDGSDRVDLGESDRIRLLARHLLSGLRGSFMRGRSTSTVSAQLAELAGLLLTPLAGSGIEAVVVPPPDLLGIPWTAMAGALDRTTALSVSPSAGLWARAHGQAQRRETFGAVAGPRLAFSANEVEQLQQVYDDTSDLLTGDAATVGAVLETMGRCDRLHAVAHTMLRDDNPMFSSLELADGFLNLYDLEGLDSVPDTVVLSACDSAHDNVVGGHEMYGLTSLLLSRGTRSVIATVAPIPDSAASVDAAVRIHNALNGGATASAAVRDAQLGVDTGTVDPSLAFVAYGA